MCLVSSELGAGSGYRISVPHALIWFLPFIFCDSLLILVDMPSFGRQERSSLDRGTDIRRIG